MYTRDYDTPIPPMFPQSSVAFRLYNADLLNREDEEVAFKEQLATIPAKIN